MSHRQRNEGMGTMSGKSWDEWEKGIHATFGAVEHLTTAQRTLALREARGWLADRGVAGAWRMAPVKVWQSVAASYDGGIAAFLSDTRAIWEG